MSNVLRWRAELGAVGGQVLLVLSFHSLVLGCALWLQRRSVRRRLPLHLTGVCWKTGCRMAGMGARASFGTKEPAEGDLGAILEVRIGIDRFLLL